MQINVSFLFKRHSTSLNPSEWNLHEPVYMLQVYSTNRLHFLRMIWMRKYSCIYRRHLNFSLNYLQNLWLIISHDLLSIYKNLRKKLEKVTSLWVLLWSTDPVHHDSMIILWLWRLNLWEWSVYLWLEHLQIYTLLNLWSNALSTKTLHLSVSRHKVGCRYPPTRVILPF